MLGYRVVEGEVRDPTGRPVDVGFIDHSADQLDEVTAIATFEASLTAPFSPLLDCGTSGDGTLVVVWPRAQPLFEASCLVPPSPAVAVSLAQAMLHGSEVLTRALQAQAHPFQRVPLPKHAGVDANGLVLRAPLVRPHLPLRLGNLRGARFLAPEMLRDQPWHPATDVFSVGAALVELITGKPLCPIEEDLAAGLAMLTRAELPAPLATLGVPGALAEVIAPAFLAAAPERRCPNAAEARALLAPFVASEEELRRWLAAALESC